MNLDLTGKNALVCGSSKGIGRSCALRLASQGAKIHLLARTKAGLESVLAEIPKSAQGEIIIADTANTKELLDAIQALLKKENSIEILINNSGGPKGGILSDASQDDFLQAFNQHLVANALASQLLLPGMKESRYGRIINIVSTSVKAPLKGLGVSNTIRGAVASWSKTLASEVALYNITVNCVLPGATETGRLEAIITNNAIKKGCSQDVIRQEMLEEIPAKRFGKPEEIANLVGFLASSAAGYITGTAIPVDGGRLPCL